MGLPYELMIEKEHLHSHNEFLSVTHQFFFTWQQVQEEEEEEWDKWDDEAEWDAEDWWQPLASPLGSDPSVQSDSSQQQHSGVSDYIYSIILC